MVDFFLKLVFTGFMVVMFFHGCTAIQSRRVYAKGRWYERSHDYVSYWSIVFIYLLTPPLLTYLVLRSRLK